MIYDNNQFLTTEGPEEGGRHGGGDRGEKKKILCDPDRLHKSALFKWANIIWSAALWSIIPDSYPSRERGINHQAKLFSSVHPPRHRHTHTPTYTAHTHAYTHTSFLSTSLPSSFSAYTVPALLCRFSLLVLLNAEQCFAAIILNGFAPQSV